MEKLHLITHEPKKYSADDLKTFWSKNAKSKLPYKWSADSKQSFKWFGFVGYEIHYSGELRVRRKSILKEKQKQIATIAQITSAVEKGQRKNSESVYESTINRLIGMSVGRIRLSTYNSDSNAMSWVDGFKLLKDGKYLRRQLKDLDRSRARNVSRLLRILKSKKSINLKKNRKDASRKLSKLPRYYGRPFSYYYQIIERRKA